MEKKCKHCNCKCHCNVKEHGDMYGLCSCLTCEHETEECEACQQIQENIVIRILKKRKILENVVNLTNKKKQNKGVDVDRLLYLTKENTAKTPEGEVLDELGLTKMCCRRHMLTHVDVE